MCRAKCACETDEDLAWHVVDGQLACYACAAWCRDCEASRFEDTLITDGNINDAWTAHTCNRHEQECGECFGVVPAGEPVTDQERALCSQCKASVNKD